MKGAEWQLNINPSKNNVFVGSVLGLGLKVTLVLRPTSSARTRGRVAQAPMGGGGKAALNLSIYYE